MAAFIVDDLDRVLILSSPPKRGRTGTWEVVSGGVEPGETLLEAAMREVREEAGTDLRVRPLGVIHGYSFPFDETVEWMISIAFLFACDGGTVRPGDDVANSQARWISPEEIERGEVEIIIPGNQNWLFRHAVESRRLLEPRGPVRLQPERDSEY